jgi:tetratricopeptide (TPR) repeat protein
MMTKRIVLFALLSMLAVGQASADGNEWIAEGDLALEKNEPGPAIGYYTQAIDSGDLSDAELRDAYWGRAVANFDKNLDDLHIDHSDRIDGFENCIEDLETARSYGKQMNADFYMKRGQCSEQIGLKNEAITAYLKVLDLEASERDRALSIYSLGNLYRGQGVMDKAVLYFGKCADGDPASRVTKGCQRELNKLTSGAE